MRIILFIIFLIPSFVFAACPGGSLTSNQTAETIGAVINSSGIAKDRITTNTTGTQKVFKNGAWVDVDVYEACVQPNPVTCTAPMLKVAGQFGVNYSCKPPPCPSTHPISAANGTQCKNENGCTEDQTFSAGVCVNKKSEEILQRCIAAASSTGGYGNLIVPSDGSSPTCVVGASGFGTGAACTNAPGGTACVKADTVGTDKTGYQCGSLNGSPVCVSSSETSAIGTSSKQLGSTSQSGTPKTIEEQVSTMGETTTTVKTIIPDVQQTTTVNDSSPVGEGQQVDSGGGSSPVAPITCFNGMKAANLQSCDTNIVCASDSYAAYGACIKAPTRTTSVVKENTTTTTTVKNDSTGQTVSQNQTTSSTTTPVKNPSALGTAQNQVSGQCDPTAKNYQECVGLITSVADTFVADQRTALDASGTTQADAYKTARQNDINTVTSDGLGVSTTSNRSLVNPLALASSTCQPYTFTFMSRSFTLNCDWSDKLKLVLAWACYLITLHQIFVVTFRKPSIT